MHEKAIIYGARWKSHECSTRALSIPEVLPCFSDENKIVPTQIPSLYAFLTLAPSLSLNSAACYLDFCALYETPGCTYRLIHVDKCFECLNQSSVLSLTMTKNLQSGQCNKRMSLCEINNVEAQFFIVSLGTNILPVSTHDELSGNIFFSHSGVTESLDMLVMVL